VIPRIALAIGFLTRIPVGAKSACDPKEIARSLRWFPLVGGLLGGISAAAYWLLSRLFPPLITAVLIVAVDAALTGAMHFDGVADTADGFGGGRTTDDVLRIMRDHAVGSFGALALILLVALKVTAIATFVGNRQAFTALFLAPVLGRWSAVLLSALQPYARPPDHDSPQSVGSPARFVGRVEAIVATVTALALAAAAGRWTGGAAMVLVAAVVIWWGWCCRRRIGGVTGDTIGAGVEISECLVLLLFAALV
jgi:adenosylcobinamide-GDP ribazoletransferase